jgi:ammonium transporter Rh
MQSLYGSTIATYFASVRLRGKIAAADIANATLAGGVAIGSTCDLAVPGVVFAIGILVTIMLTAGSGVISGKVISALGRREEPCLDDEEFDGDACAPEEDQPLTAATEPV